MHKHKLHRMVSKFSVHMLLCGVQEMDTEHADNLPPMFKDICIRSFFLYSNYLVSCLQL